MRKRTGPIGASRVARLNGFRLAFNVTDAIGAERYANIVPTPGATVWGVAYWCSPAAMAALDEYECVAEGCYNRRWINVETIDGERLKVEVYIGGERFAVAEGRPSEWYLKIILEGATQHGLSAEYVRAIEALAAGPNS